MLSSGCSGAIPFTKEICTIPYRDFQGFTAVQRENAEKRGGVDRGPVVAYVEPLGLFGNQGNKFLYIFQRMKLDHEFVHFQPPNRCTKYCFSCIIMDGSKHSMSNIIAGFCGFAIDGLDE